MGRARRERLLGTRVHDGRTAAGTRTLVGPLPLLTRPAFESLVRKAHYEGAHSWARTWAGHNYTTDPAGTSAAAFAAGTDVNCGFVYQFFLYRRRDSNPGR